MIGNDSICESDNGTRDIVVRGDILSFKPENGNGFEVYGRGLKYLNGSNKDDILIGSATDEKVRGGRGADVYVLSGGIDKFMGFNTGEGDVVHINSVIDYEITSTLENKTQIVHELGVTTVKGISADDLQSVIQIV